MDPYKDNKKAFHSFAHSRPFIDFPPWPFAGGVAGIGTAGCYASRQQEVLVKIWSLNPNYAGMLRAMSLAYFQPNKALQKINMHAL